MIVTSEYAVEHNSKREVAVIMSAIFYDDDDDDDDDDDNNDDGGGGGGGGDDDEIKEKMITVIIETTGTISKSFRKYLSNIPGKHESEKYKKIKTAVLDITHIHTAESTNVKVQNICNI